MGVKRNTDLSPRKEETRVANDITPPVQFTLSEIKDHFTQSMETIKKQYDIADSLMKAADIEGSKTIWRSQVVLAEGVLDFYIHEMSKYCMFRMFTGKWEKSQQYSSFNVPMVKVEEAINTGNSKDWFYDYLNAQFSRDVFLSCEHMKDQLNRIGIDFGTVMVTAFPRAKRGESLKYGKKVVADLFQRRNEIAHQNDRSHASAEQTDISRSFVEEYILKIESIVEAIHKIAEEKDS